MIRTRKIILTPSTKPRRLLKQHADYRRDAHNWTLRDYKDKLRCRRTASHQHALARVGRRASISVSAVHPVVPERRPACCLCAGKRDQGRGGQRPAITKPPGSMARTTRLPFAPTSERSKSGVKKSASNCRTSAAFRMRRSLRPEGRISAVTVTHEDERWWGLRGGGNEESARKSRYRDHRRRRGRRNHRGVLGRNTLRDPRGAKVPAARDRLPHAASGPAG